MGFKRDVVGQFQQIVSIGQRSPELRLPPIPEDWKIEVIISDESALTLSMEAGCIIVVVGKQTASTHPVQVELDRHTLMAILDNDLTPTKAWSEGLLKVKGLALAHFTDPSFSILFQLLRCGVGRRLPPR